MRVLFFLSVLACSGCSIEKADPAKSAEFRFVARDIYADLLSPSCDAPAGFNRHELLRSELDAVSKFERQVKGTEPGNQLAIARQDVQYSQQTGKGCWNDDDLRFAKLHVEMTKKTVRNGLGTLRSLRPDLGSESDSLLTGSDDQSAFRYDVSLLVQMVSPMCDLHIERKNDELLTPAKREVDHFEQTLAGTSYAAHYAIAKEDVAYKQSITIVECADRSDQPPNLISAGALADAKKQIAAVARMMKD
jgi:hypothetical protein